MFPEIKCISKSTDNINFEVLTKFHILEPISFRRLGTEFFETFNLCSYIKTEEKSHFNNSHIDFLSEDMRIIFNKNEIMI